MTLLSQGCILWQDRGTVPRNTRGRFYCVASILDADGSEIKSYTYNAYGKEKAFTPNPEGSNTIIYYWKNETSNSTHNPFRFCGEYFDKESELIYLRNRYYDPSIGRFITEDPARDGLNWYVYCRNNPVVFVDPWGLVPVSIRDFTDDYNGNTTWDGATRTASFTISGSTLITNSNGQNDYGMNIWNEDGRMMADDADLYNFFGAIQSSGYGYSNAAFYNEETNVYDVTTNIDVLGTDLNYEYAIKDGAVLFDYEKNDYWSVLYQGSGKKLANAIYHAAKSISDDYLSNRTVGGINIELQLHWASYTVGFMKEKASPANIGGINSTKPGYDDNAWFFQSAQAAIIIAKLSINPKVGFIDALREVGGYLR